MIECDQRRVCTWFRGLSATEVALAGPAYFLQVLRELALREVFRELALRVLSE